MLEYIINLQFDHEKKEAVRLVEFKEQNNVSNKKNLRKLRNGVALDLDPSMETFLRGAPPFNDYGTEPELIIVHENKEALQL